MASASGTDRDDFAHLVARRRLRRFLTSDPGTLYFDPEDSSTGGSLVRYFDQPAGSSFATTYAAVIASVADWLASRPELADLVDVEPVTHVGADYIARPHAIYHISTESYAHVEDGVPAPRELAEMRERVGAALQALASDGRDGVLAGVVRRTLLEPTGRVYFDDVRRRFIVVEPKVQAEDVSRWGAAG